MRTLWDEFDAETTYTPYPSYLVPSGCHNGGAYDLHLQDTSFP